MCLHRHYSSEPSRPPWLTSLLRDSSPPPKIYNWVPGSNPPSSPARDPRRIHILGLGNIGRLYAVHLARYQPNPPPITLVLHRRELLAHWHANPGIKITRRAQGTVYSVHEGLEVEYWTDDSAGEGGGSASEIGPIDNLIVATKADAAMPEADKLRRYLSANSTVAFAQNGMSQLWPPHGPAYIGHRWADGEAPSFAACITTHGVISHGPFRSEHASLADAKAGLVLPNPRSSGAGEYLVEAIASAPGLKSRRVPRADLWVLQLEKLVVNSVINPMTAILRCKNGLLFTERSGVLVEVMDLLLQETSAVYQALVNHQSTVDILSTSSPGEVNLGNESLEAIRNRLTDRFAVGSMRDMLWGVGYKVAENTSSMLQDVKAGKMTEVRAFNGWVVDMARFLDQGLQVPSHQSLVKLVEAGGTLSPNQLREAVLGRG